jgi:hypothetical protein
LCYSGFFKASFREFRRYYRTSLLSLLSLQRCATIGGIAPGADLVTLEGEERGGEQTRFTAAVHHCSTLATHITSQYITQHHIHIYICMYVIIIPGESTSLETYIAAVPRDLPLVLNLGSYS